MTRLPTILLTGATGFLGSHLLEALINKGYKVVILKRSTSKLWRIQHLVASVISYDVDVEPLEQAFKEQYIDVVIHTACHYGRNGDSKSEIVETNVLYGTQILDSCIKHNTQTFINTDTLLGKNLNTYSLSKKQFVEWLKKESENTQVINLKPEHMFGPKDDSTKFVSWILHQLREGVPIINLTKGEQERDFVYVNDVVSAYIAVLEKRQTLGMFSEFDIGSGQLTTVREFLEKLTSVYVGTIGPTKTKLAFGKIPYRDGESMTVELNIQPLKDLGWSAKTTLTHGIKELIKEIA